MELFIKFRKFIMAKRDLIFFVLLFGIQFEIYENSPLIEILPFPAAQTNFS